MVNTLDTVTFSYSENKIQAWNSPNSPKSITGLGMELSACPANKGPEFNSNELRTVKSITISLSCICFAFSFFLSTFTHSSFFPFDVSFPSFTIYFSYWIVFTLSHFMLSMSAHMFLVYCTYGYGLELHPYTYKSIYLFFYF